MCRKGQPDLQLAFPCMGMQPCSLMLAASCCIVHATFLSDYPLIRSLLYSKCCSRPVSPEAGQAAHPTCLHWLLTPDIRAHSLCCTAESRRKLVMHLGMFDDLWSAASLVPSAREDGLDVFLIGNRNCPPFVRGTAFSGSLLFTQAWTMLASMLSAFWTRIREELALTAMSMKVMIHTPPSTALW